MSDRRRVLVTGAQGFIGRYCVPRLAERDFVVIGLAQPGNPTPLPPGAHDWQEADILDPAAVVSLMEAVRPSHLLHLAWFTQHGAFWHAAENLSWVAATLRLFLAARSVDCERMLAVGTGAEYGPAIEPCSENDTPCAPEGLYGICKDALRRCLLSASEDGRPGVAWARLFFPYGPHDNPARLIRT